MAVVIKSFAISGIGAYVVNIETEITFGKPNTVIVGLGDASVKEAKERIEASINNEKYEYPKMKIVINLSPCDIKKTGSHFDLGMAIGILLKSNQINFPEVNEFAFIGELSLNGDLRGVTGVLPMIIEAKKQGIKKIILPKVNYREGKLVSGIEVYAFDKLIDVISYLEKRTPYEIINEVYEEISNDDKFLDFKDVEGQDSVVDFVVAAAAGGHNILLTGPPGCGKSMIAKRIPTILPKMTEEEALEVTKIYSVAGLLKDRGSLITKIPFRTPHNNASLNALIGGGTYAKPGEISLAHNGVLFLDEIAEFNKNNLEALRQPMEDNYVSISRVKQSECYPSNFMLVAAMNPCPCGYYGEERCRCTDYEVMKYRNKISGPVLDRIDIQKSVKGVNLSNITYHKDGRSSKELREMVEMARNIQNIRFSQYDGINCNSQMPNTLAKEICLLDSESYKLLENAYERFSFSLRSYYKFLNLARTFADLEGEKNINRNHIIKAIMCRDMEKEESKMMTI